MPAIFMAMIDDEDDKIRFKKLYDENLQHMYSIAFSVLHNKQDAEDAVQIAFFNIANNFHRLSFRSSAKAAAFCSAVCRNVSINFYNSNKKRSDRIISIEAIRNVPESEFEESNYSKLKDAIVQLPSSYKDVIYLYYVDNLPIKTIATMLNKKPENIYQTIARAKEKIKLFLRKNGS